MIPKHGRIKGAIPATVENLVHMKNSTSPHVTWSVTGTGRAQLVMNTQAIEARWMLHLDKPRRRNKGREEHPLYMPR